MIQSHSRRLAVVIVPLALVFSSATSFGQALPLKVAVVNVEKIVTESTAGQGLQKRLDNFREQIQADLQAKAQAASQLRTDAALASDPAQQARLQKQFEDASIALQREQDDKQREGQKMQDEGLREIERTLAPIFRQIRDEQGYDLILALTPGIVLMISDRVDITQSVLDRYNASATP